MRGVVLDAVPLELAPAPAPPRLLQECGVAADRQQLFHLVVEELVVLAPASALEEEGLAPQLLDLVGVVGRGRAPQRRRPVWKSKFYGAFALNRRIDPTHWLIFTQPATSRAAGRGPRRARLAPIERR